MREFFELVNEYPWTTFFLLLGFVVLIGSISGAISEIIHGPDKRTIIIESDKKDNEEKSE